jgi:hypothetical protein
VAATATARASNRSAAAKAPKGGSAPRRRPAARRRSAAPKRRQRSQLTPIPGRLVPVAVGATAGAVGGLANSGLVVRLTRGRLWIGALAVLLVGIVALNVMALSLNASSSKTGRQADALKQQNSALRAQLAGQVSSQKVQRLAISLGLGFPAPGDIRYLEPASDDAAVAARRLRSGELAFTETAPVAPAPITETTAPAEQTAPPAEEPVATEPAAPVPTPTEPTQTEPPAGPAAGGGGGVASP